MCLDFLKLTSNFKPRHPCHIELVEMLFQEHIILKRCEKLDLRSEIIV